MLAGEFTEQIQRRWRSRRNGFVVQVVLDVDGEAFGGVVAPLTIFVESFHDDPVEIALQLPVQAIDRNAAVLGDDG